MQDLIHQGSLLFAIIPHPCFLLVDLLCCLTVREGCPYCDSTKISEYELHNWGLEHVITRFPSEENIFKISDRLLVLIIDRRITVKSVVKLGTVC